MGADRVSRHRRRGTLRRSAKAEDPRDHRTRRQAQNGYAAPGRCATRCCRWATSFHETRAFPESAALAEAAIRDIVPDADIAIMRPPQAGDYSFNNIGLPSWFMLSSTMPEALRREKGYYDVSGCGANIAWHTENDTMEIADRDNLLRDIRIYLLSVLRAVLPAALPFDYRATCDTFLQTIARYETASGGLADLSAARQTVEAFRTHLDALAPTEASNAALRELAHVLIPLDTTREPRFRHDPAYTTPPLPTLAIAAELGSFHGLARGFAQTELLRGQNRFVAAMHAAARVIRVK